MENKGFYDATADGQTEEMMYRWKLLNLNLGLIDFYKQNGEPPVLDPITGEWEKLTPEQHLTVQRYQYYKGDLIYLVIRSFHMNVPMESYVYVSCHTSMWEYERSLIANGFLDTVTRNLLYPDKSAFTTIAYERHPNGFPMRMTSLSMKQVTGKGPKVEAIVHSEQKHQIVELIMQMDYNDFIVKTEADVYCHAVFNPYSQLFFAEDEYSVVDETQIPGMVILS